MRKFKIIMILVLIVLLSTTVFGINVDTVHPGHNSNFNLRYGSGRTQCTDTSSAHSYWTYGDAINTHSARLMVYVLNSAGEIQNSDVSTSTNTFAAAWWTRSSTTSHNHRAGSLSQ